MITFDKIRKEWELKPIRNCPGRFVIHLPDAELSLQDLFGQNVEVQIFQVAAARDTVLVVRMDEGGLISYRRTDGTYLHTLNTTEGFARKLLSLNIEVADGKT
jgi:hypothetical protein